jgi:hypothetical protein
VVGGVEKTMVAQIPPPVSKGIFVARLRSPEVCSASGNRSTTLLVATVLVGILAFAIPYLPFAPLLGFVPLSGRVVAALVLVTALYVVCAELVKYRFYRRTA